MFPSSKSKKEKKANSFVCHRRLGIYKKKNYKHKHQLIYVSLSGRIYTNSNYKDVVQVDNRILNELKISKTGIKSCINDVKLMYRIVNGLKKNEEERNFDEKMFEYYCIPPSIITEYNQLGIYELYKEQAECLRNILQNEQVENDIHNKMEEIRNEECNAKNIDYILNSDFFIPFEKEFRQRDEDQEERRQMLCTQNGQRRERNVNIYDEKWNIIYMNNITKNNFFYKNFLFNIPTGMGKTIIYDILIIRLVLYKGYRVILTLPTVSLINEKNDYYEKLLGENTVSLNIKKFNSFNFTGYSYSLSTDIALCTYEQANIILNIIIKNNLKCNYIFIIDEIHYINDMQRGYFIESLLTKIKYIQKNCESIFNIRACGFSATLSNVDQIGEWLDAKVYVSKEKLQKIKYLYKIENAIYKDIHKKELERTLDVPFYLDPDHLVFLLSEELILQRNVLIFCPTKKKSEQIASFISNIMPYYLKNKNYKVDGQLLEKRMKLIKELKEMSVKIPDVEKFILAGILYHHSELDKNEKEIIESAFRNNILFCLCCTTTLSVGVNFNVHTVIIRSLRLGKAFLTKDQIVQIAGRCGRIKKVHQAGTTPECAGGIGGSGGNGGSCGSCRICRICRICRSGDLNDVLSSSPKSCLNSGQNSGSKSCLNSCLNSGQNSGSKSCQNSGSKSCQNSGSKSCQNSGSKSCLNSGSKSCQNSGSKSCLNSGQNSGLRKGRGNPEDQEKVCIGRGEVKDYDIDCDGKVLIFLASCDKTCMERILKDDVDVCNLKTKLHNFQLCKFIIEFIELNLIKTKKDMFDFLSLYTLKFFKINKRDEKKSNTNSNNVINSKDLIMQEIKQTFQYLFENKLIIIPYEKEQGYYYSLFAKIYNTNLYNIENLFDFHFLNKYINVDLLIKYNLQQKIELFKKLHKNYKLKYFLNQEKQFFSLPFVTILLIFKDTQFNKNLFQNIFVQFIKYLFLINVNTKQYSFYVYDILKDDDIISCTEMSPYVHPIYNALDFIFNYTFIQYVYVKGFPTDTLLMIFVFCINSEISLKIHFDVYEEMIISSNSNEDGNVKKIFQYFDLSIDKLKRFKSWKNEHLCVESAKNILRGETDIDEICENFEWVKIKRFYFSLIVYDLFREDTYTVGKKYRLKIKEIKNLYVKCCYNLSFNCKVLRNFKNSLDIFCIALENLLLKMKSKILSFVF
ncbi:helicase [Plasmodium gonderi]|uniref:Helicase n=1 Tax=Plasmodium gonderi TaxID=77519 RepID=A0A1Y1JLC3_PLAGO|nr:helicase [Plasmodium gonderi]GAW82255.1 helicase [Plasmodium gonderi]